MKIRRDDEQRLTARERGHTYGEGDYIVGIFEREDGTFLIETVVYARAPGGGYGYYDAAGQPVSGELTDWEYR